MYKVDPNWIKLPQQWRWGWISGVACNSQDRVFVYSRSEHSLAVFDRDGNFIEVWGQGLLENAHGIYIDLVDNVWLTDYTTHCVYQFDRHGQLVQIIGEPGKPADREGDPFNQPTDLAVASTGELFISDGYANFRIHKFSPQGEWLLSWGEQGEGPGQFALPHCVRVDRYDRVWVCDRENYRIQIFDSAGKYLTEWNDIQRPGAVHFDPKDDIVYIAEMERQISIYALDGDLITRWGGGVESERPGEFLAFPHDIWVDSHGDIYVTEVGVDGRIQKYVRQF